MPWEPCQDLQEEEEAAGPLRQPRAIVPMWLIRKRSEEEVDLEVPLLPCKA